MWDLFIKTFLGLRHSIRPLFAAQGLTGAQWRVCRLLGEAGPRGLTLGEISQGMLVTHGNTTGLVDKLEQSGLAQRSPHPEDRRAVLVRLTAAGERLYKRVGPAFQQRVGELVGCLSEPEKKQLAGLLTRLSDHAHGLMHAVAKGCGAASSERPSGAD